MKFRALLFFFSVSCSASLAFAQQAPPREPAEILLLLNRVQPDPAATYKIQPSHRIELRRGDAKMLFEEGELALFQPVGGKITGAVFSGRGHILATPRDPVEKQQLAFFLGAPVLDQDFTNVYLRFSEDTADELLHQLSTAKVAPQTDSNFTDVWQSAVTLRNPGHSLRLLYESLSQTMHPYFAAAFGGVQTGPFDFFFDQMRDEPEMMGQIKKISGAEYYDIWSSSRPPGTTRLPQGFHALQYKIDATIHPDNSLSGEATVRLRTETPGERLIGFEFSRFLNVQSASLAGETLFTYPNDATTSDERKARGTDALYVVLPRPPKKGDELEITFRYRGNVIRDAGNGVLFVGAREGWYPHYGDAAEFSDYDLTFHWPRKLRLAATGTKLGEREEGDQRTGHWHTDKPAPVAGFNLGEYAFASLASNGHSVDVYANRQLELALVNRLRLPDVDTVQGIPRPFGGLSTQQRMAMTMPDPSPADALKSLARDIDSSIRFYETYSGPFPVKQLSVSQIPGSFGQGWPGLLYLSTYSFLEASAQERVGLSETGQEHFHDLVPFHEVAHQWWGNVVGWSNYRDQWIDEALSSYLSLLFADSQKSPDHRLRAWLERYRKRLLEKKESESVAPADLGGLTLGSRLDSSHMPAGYEPLVYGKGAWIFHMIREMMRDPRGKTPDARFTTFLQGLQQKYAYRALSSEDLQRELEDAMTPAMTIESRHSMEWFFADWVRGAGIPHYKLEYSTKQSEKGFVVKGKILQSGVPNTFVAPVPVYAAGGEYLGRVIVGGSETPFHFVTQHQPGKLALDPQMTLLCVVEK
jgi:hypothetical protein